MLRVFRGLLAGLLVFLILGLRVAAAPTAPSGPAFSSIPEPEQVYRLLYEQKFPEARDIIQKWAAEHPDEPFGQVSNCRQPLVRRVLSPADTDQRLLSG